MLIRVAFESAGISIQRLPTSSALGASLDLPFSAT
jgi:hypothetical protein